MILAGTTNQQAVFIVRTFRAANQSNGGASQITI